MSLTPDLTGQYPPLYIITDTDKRGSIVLASALAVTFICLTLIIRTYIQLALNQATWLRDDNATAIATLVGVIQSIFVFVAVGKGFGLSSSLFDSTVDIDGALRLLYAGDFFYLTTLFLAKCAYGLLFLRIAFGIRTFHLMVWGMVAASGVWWLISIILISAGCHQGDHPDADDAISCPNPYLRWQIITGLDIATEILLVALSVVLVYSLQTSMRRKLTVVTAFGCRIATVVFAALHLHYLWNAIYSDDPSLDGADAVLWGQIEIAYALIACTLPCIQPYLTALSTEGGTANILVTAEGKYGTQPVSNFSHPRTEWNGRQTGTLSKSVGERDGDDGWPNGNGTVHSPTPALAPPADLEAGTPSSMMGNGNAVQGARVDESLLRGDTFKHATTVSHDAGYDRTSVGSGEGGAAGTDDDERRMIIKKEVQWMVEHGDKRGQTGAPAVSGEPAAEHAAA